MRFRLPETPPYGAYLVRGSLADDDLWNLVVATVTEAMELNSSTKVDIKWLVTDRDPWTSRAPIAEPTGERPTGLVLVADEQTATDDTVAAMVLGSGTARRIPVDEAAWETFVLLIDADRLDQG